MMPRILKLLVIVDLVLAVPLAAVSALPDGQSPSTPLQRLQQ